jgi:preprotein translocase subunit SecD
VTKIIAIIALGAVSLGFAARPAGASYKDQAHHLRFRPVLAELPPKSAATRPDQINAILDSCPTNPDSALGAIAQIDPATIPNTRRSNDKAGACVVLNPIRQQIRYLLAPAVLTERDVVAAKNEFSKGMGYAVTVLLTHSGRDKLNRLAQETVPKPSPQNEAAIVLDGVVLSAPQFQTTFFPDRTIQITGRFSKHEAADLAAAVTLAARKN